LPKIDFERVLDVGVGTGFITRDLPFKEFVGLDISETAIDYLNSYFIENEKANTHKAIALSLLDQQVTKLGKFDLIVLTGVLYPHYLGENRVAVNKHLLEIASDNCIVMSVHISDWNPFTLDENFIEIDRWLYPYREFSHELIVTRRIS
jgi:SAM-dependent methyltransferase